MPVIPYILAYLPDATQVPQHWLAAVESELPYARRVAAQAPLQRRLSLCGLALARALVATAGATPSPGAWRFDASGAVSIEGAPAFSISHARTVVGCVLALRGAVGFDVEHAADVQVESLRLLQTSAGFAATLPPVTQWTLREAALKHAGTGLQSLPSQQLQDSIAWISVPLPGGFCGSIVGDAAHVASRVQICDGFALLQRQLRLACGDTRDD